MPTTRRYLDNRTGTSHDINWDSNVEPSDREIEVLIRQAERRKRAITNPPEEEDNRYWFNKPLSGGGIANWVRERNKKSTGDLEKKYADQGEPTTALGRGFRSTERFLTDKSDKLSEFIGGMADEQTTPLDIATTAGTMGSSLYLKPAMESLRLARLAGNTEKAAKIANSIEKANKVSKVANAATGTRGAYNVGAGLTDEKGIDWSKAGFGALELGLSAHGYHGSSQASAALGTESASAAFKERNPNFFDEVTTHGQEPFNKYRGDFSDEGRLLGSRPQRKLLHSPARFVNESGIISDNPLNLSNYHEPIGPDLPEGGMPVQPKPKPKQIGSGIRFQGFGDVIADTRAGKSTRNKAPISTAEILAEAERKGLQADDSGRVLPTRKPPNVGTGKLLYDEAGNVIKEDKLGRKIPSRSQSDLPDIDVTPLRSEKVEAIPVDSKKIVDDAYASMSDDVLEMFRKQGHKGAIKELARRRGETGSLFGGGKADKGSLGSFIEDGSLAKLGAKVSTAARNLFEDETGAVGKIKDPNAPKIKKDPDFSYNGEHNITFPNGAKTKMFYDSASQTWYHTGEHANKNTGPHSSHHSTEWEFGKQDLIDKLHQKFDPDSFAARNAPKNTNEGITGRFIGHDKPYIDIDTPTLSDKVQGGMGADEFSNVFNKAMASAEKPYLSDIVKDIRSLANQNTPEAQSKLGQLVDQFTQRIERSDPSAHNINHNEVMSLFDRAKSDGNVSEARILKTLTDITGSKLQKQAKPKSNPLNLLKDEKGAVTVNRGKTYFKKDGTLDPETNPKTIVKRVKENLPVARRWDETKFLTPDGMRYNHNHYIHESALNELGTNLEQAGKSAGVVRVAEDARGVEIRRPITHEQAIQMADMPHYNNSHTLYADVHGADGRLYSKDFGTDATPDQIRNWVQSKFNKEPVKSANPMDLLRSETGAVKWGKTTKIPPAESVPPGGVTLGKEVSKEPIKAKVSKDNPLETQSAKVKPTSSYADKIKRSFAMINDPDSAVQKMKPAYQEWVNTRAAAEGSAYNVRQDFKELDKLGMDGVHAYLAGERGGKLAEVADWFKQNHKKLIFANIDEVPITHLWDNSADEIQDVFGTKKIVIRKGQEFKPIVDTLKEGIERGLTPKYKTMPELMGYYSETIDKAIANEKYYKFLDDNKIRHYSKVQDINKNYLEDNRNPAIKTILRGIQLTKDVAMASGIPGTAFNAHGVNMFLRSYSMGGPTSMAKALGYMMNPGSDQAISKIIESVAPWESAAKNIEKKRQLIPRLLEAGGRLGVENHQFDEKIADAALGKWGNESVNWLTEQHKNLFETHLFDKMIPALKLDYFESATKDLVKTGMSVKEAEKAAAHAMNLGYAGINYDELATNKHMMDIVRMIFLAPDWYASNIGMAKSVVKSVNPFSAGNKDPGAALYRKMGTGIISIYGAANVANHALTKLNSDDNKGHFMWDNDPGHSMDIDTGAYTINDKGEKKKVYISPFGTAFDVFKVSANLLSELYKDAETGKGSPVSAVANVFKNRLALPVHTGVNLLSGFSDLGRSERGRDAYGNDIDTGTELKNIGSEIANPFTPAYVKGIGGYALGDMDPIEAVNQSIEGPLKFAKTPTPKGSGRPSRPSRPSRR